MQKMYSIHNVIWFGRDTDFQIGNKYEKEMKQSEEDNYKTKKIERNRKRNSKA